MSHLNVAYTLGAETARLDFEKEGMGMEGGAPVPQELGQEQAAGAMGEPPPAEQGAAPPPPNLGDPNYWSGGTPPPGEEGSGAASAASAEEAAGLLPEGAFQGLNTRVTPDGERSTGVKVSPAALDAPEVLKAMFQAEPGVRVEITETETPSSVTSFRESR